MSTLDRHVRRQAHQQAIRQQQAMDAQAACELAEMQLREMRQRQYPGVQAVQPKHLMNTRPLNESPALHQMMMRSREIASACRVRGDESFNRTGAHFFGFTVFYVVVWI